MENRLLYHGTGRPKRVMEQGVKPNMLPSKMGGGGKKGYINLTTSYRMACFFGTPLIVQVPDPSLLVESELRSTTSGAYLDYEKAFIYPKPIPSSKVTMSPRDRQQADDV